MIRLGLRKIAGGPVCWLAGYGGPESERFVIYPQATD